MPIPQAKTESYPKTAKDRVFSVMREWIINGTLKPGEKIFDKEIADYFSVSRTPVREAFQMLEEQKLITVSPGRESRVSEIDPDSIRQSYELLAVLEAMAVKFAMNHMTDECILLLKDCVEKLKASIAAGDAKAANAADHLFHETILRFSSNDFLMQFCKILETHVARIEIHFFSAHEMPDLLSASVAEPEKIIEAIQRHDIEAASCTMSENWLNTIPYIEKFL